MERLAVPGIAMQATLEVRGAPLELHQAFYWACVTISTIGCATRAHVLQLAEVRAMSAAPRMDHPRTPARASFHAGWWFVSCAVMVTSRRQPRWPIASSPWSL